MVRVHGTGFTQPQVTVHTTQTLLDPPTLNPSCCKADQIRYGHHLEVDSLRARSRRALLRQVLVPLNSRSQFFSFLACPQTCQEPPQAPFGAGQP